MSQSSSVNASSRFHATHRVFGVTGWKNSGKTTLITRLIAELTRRGYKISSVKHAHHACDIDKEGTDSFRHREAGSGEVALVAAGNRWAIMHECRDEPEPLLTDVLDRLAPCDLVMVEGYKPEPFPKIEVRREKAVQHDPIASVDNQIVAIASERPEELKAEIALPTFQIDDIAAMADFVLSHVGLADPAS